jgi:hypothetical protein
MSILMAYELQGERFVTVNNQWGTSAHRYNQLVGAAPGSFTIAMDEAEAWLRSAHAEGIGEIGGLATEVGI